MFVAENPKRAMWLIKICFDNGSLESFFSGLLLVLFRYSKDPYIEYIHICWGISHYPQVLNSANKQKISCARNSSINKRIYMTCYIIVGPGKHDDTIKQ
jgi:hypothetical protein